MNDQEIFDTVAMHLLTQGERAIVPDPNKPGAVECKYRIENDGKTLKCAAGCLIPDELYDPNMEGIRITPVVDKFNLPRWLDSPLVNELQWAHDDTEHWIDFPINLKHQLRSIAIRFNLTPHVLDNVQVNGRI